MKRNEIIGEHKKGVRAVKYNKKPTPHITPQKPKKPTQKSSEQGVAEGNWGRDSWDSNMPGWQRREQDAWDAGKRDFKRREMEHELGHEEEPYRPRRSFYKPKNKGMYFYNVPNGQEDKAQEVGLFRTKSGKWYSPFENTRAGMFFGPGRFWQPKEAVGENTPGKISNIKPGETATVDHGDGTSTTIDLKKNPTALSKDEQGKLKLNTKPATGQPQQPQGQEIKPGDQVEIDAQEATGANLSTSKSATITQEPDGTYTITWLRPPLHAADTPEEGKIPPPETGIKDLASAQRSVAMSDKADHAMASVSSSIQVYDDLERLRDLAGLVKTNEQIDRADNALMEAPISNTQIVKKLQDVGGDTFTKTLPGSAPAAGAASGGAAAATPAPKNAPHQHVPGAQWNAGVLGIGSKGAEVSALQKRLGIADTGVFDNATRDAVIQRQKELGVQADGAWGPGTAQADAAKPKQPAKPAEPEMISKSPVAPGQSPAKSTDDLTKAPKQSSIAKSTDDLTKAPNVAAPGQPPATAANPAAGTAAGATKAIPTAPVNPANPSGRSSQANISPEEAQAALDNGSPRDIAALGGAEKLQQIANSGKKQLPPSSFQKGPAPATTQPPALQKGPAPATTQPPALQKAKESAELTAMLRIAGLR